MLTISRFTTILTIKLTLCALAEHVHGHAHRECPPTDTAHTGAAAWAVQVAEHVATHTDLRHTGTTASRGLTDCDFIDFKEHRTE
jgi:hypothetical protein